MSRLVLSLIIGWLWLSPAACGTGAAEPAPGANQDRYAEAAALVRKLGDERFATRELATTQLI